MSEYTKVKELGRGAFGRAILAQCPNEELAVIKEIRVSHLKRSEVQAAEKEAAILSSMRHAHIIKYVRSFVENAHICIVMEFAAGGDLKKEIDARVEQHRLFLEADALKILAQILSALQHIHQKHILHRDIKTQNIFLTEGGDVKLGDFGVARVLDGTKDLAETQVGTPLHMVWFGCIAMHTLFIV